MNKNMGTVDRTVRVILAVSVALLYMTGQISGMAAIILGVVATIFVLTSLIGMCPLYSVFGWSTCKTSQPD